MELLKGDKRRFRGCRLAAANPAPNKKRLAQRSRRPHRPHLTWRRKIPMILWGVFSTPGLNAGEEEWKRGIIYFLTEILFPAENTGKWHQQHVVRDGTRTSPPRRA